MNDAAISPAAGTDSVARRRWRRVRRRLLAAVASVCGAGLAGTVGWVLTGSSLGLGEERAERVVPRHGWLAGAVGEALARHSYDLLFALRGTGARPEAVLVYLDENAGRALGQRSGVWDRRVHTRLLQRLAAERPRAIFFDLVFSEPSAEAEVDRELAVAMAENGQVFLCGAIELESGPHASRQQVVAPTPVLRRAAAGWGTIQFFPIDADYAVRRLCTGPEDVPSAAWRMAVALGAPLEDSAAARSARRWMNYYGPPDTFASVSYDAALAPDGVPPGFFRDRIVCVGGRSTLGTLGLGKDDFRNPHGVFGGTFSSGVELHATELLNLLRGEWLTRLPARRELWWNVGLGALLGAWLPRLRPHFATLLALGVVAAIVASAWWLFATQRVWWAWAIPAGVLAPLALGWAVGARYFLEERRRNALRRAFGHYLAPVIVDRIADAEFDLKPGGTLVEATVLITDLEGYTPLSENVGDPEKVTRILIDYFTQTTEHILANHGTIINFVGDSVTAVWGAPLAVRDHVRQAAHAAWRLREASRVVVEGREYRTRVGLHTGRVLAGNVGSARRFDYVVIGDAVNFTSRLEGLNKQLGTSILVSEAARAAMGGDFVTRCVGDFRVAGKTAVHRVHELLGLTPGEAGAQWLADFARGLEAFRRGDFAECDRWMRDVFEQRGGDGPARFYLHTLAALGGTGPADWTGVIETQGK